MFFKVNLYQFLRSVTTEFAIGSVQIRRVSQICLVSVKSDSQIRVGRSVANTSGFSKIVVKILNSHKKLTEDSSKGFTPDSESRVFLVFRSVGRFTLTKHICDTRLSTTDACQVTFSKVLLILRKETLASENL